MAKRDAASRAKGLHNTLAQWGARGRHASYHSTRRFPYAAAILCLLALSAFLTNGSAGEFYDRAEMATRFRSPVHNSYCRIPTFAVLQLPGQARAILQSNGEPLILIDAIALESRAYARFLIAHECCHHQRGHLARLEKKRQERAREERLRRPASQTALTFLAETMSYHQIELDADCCAATLLARRDDRAGLEAAIDAMAALGAKNLDSAYPPGLRRAFVIKLCSRSD